MRQSKGTRPETRTPPWQAALSSVGDQANERSENTSERVCAQALLPPRILSLHWFRSDETPNLTLNHGRMHPDPSKMGEAA